MNLHKSSLLSLVSLVLLGFSLPLNAQVTATTLGSVTNLPAVINPASASNQTSVVSLQQGRGLAIYSKWAASAGNSNATVFVTASVDGTNYSSQPWRILLFPINGTNQYSYVTNFTRTDLEGLVALNFSTITNGHATGILTNYGITFSRQP